MMKMKMKMKRPAVMSLTLSLLLAACAGATVEADYPDTYEGATAETGSLFSLFGLTNKIGANKTGGDKTGDDATKTDDTTSQTASQTTSQTTSQTGPQAEVGTQDAAPAPALRGLAVNADLWRAALDTVSFMPLSSADPLGGTIITDWYNDPGQPGERVKLNLVISGLELRADAVRVSLFREKQVNERWINVATSSLAERQLENIVLSEARDFVMARRRNQ